MKTIPLILLAISLIANCLAIDKPNVNRCPENERFVECVPCSDSCEVIWNPGQLACKKKCEKGCTCNIGFARNIKRTCIPVNTCPEALNRTECTKENEKLWEFIPCPITCNDFLSPEFCLSGGKGCGCITDFVRDSNNNCIPVGYCPIN